jgi:Common central domain of tyrosinase
VSSVGLRKNHKSLSEAEKSRYIAAVKKMKAETAEPYNYDKFVKMHASVAASANPDDNPAHRGPAFLPWHRHLLLKFEQDLQAADRALGGDGTLTLPYWDWPQDDPSTPDRQPGGLWHDEFMGGPGNPVSGSFSSWVTLPPGGSKLRRGLGSPPALVSTLPRRADVDRALSSEGYDCPPFDDTRADSGTGVPAPPAPTAAGTPGGSLAPGTYRVATTYVNTPLSPHEGETRPSPEACVCLGEGCEPANADTAITVDSPPPPPGVNGYRVYVSAADGEPGSGTRQGGLTPIGTAATINTLTAGAPRPSVNTTSSFRNILEGWLSARTPPDLPIETHNRVHVWVAGSMEFASSPNDPVFFLHHCNIDRLWGMWQSLHPGQNYPVAVPRVNGPGSRPEGLNDPMPPWNTLEETVRPIDVLDHTSITVGDQTLGYTYDTDPPDASVDLSA